MDLPECEHGRCCNYGLEHFLVVTDVMLLSVIMLYGYYVLFYFSLNSGMFTRA